MRIIVFGERLSPPPDEGIKKLTLNLAAALRDLGHDILLLTTSAADWPEQAVRNVPADRLLRSRELAAAIRSFHAHATVYVPTASLTLASGARAAMLRGHGGGAVALIATQARRHSPAVRLVGRVANRLAAPDLCAAQSAVTLAQARALGWRATRLPQGVDLAAFRPVSPETKTQLRARHGLPPDAFVVFHAGHLNRSRGVLDLAASADLACPVLAASTSTSQDVALAGELRTAGVRVIGEYVAHIAELYQAADAYLFPVPPDPLAPSSIDVPLSVLEAAACDLPIVATRFGALPELWTDCPGVHFYDEPAGLRAALAGLRARRGSPGTRRLAEPFGWDAAASSLLAALAPLVRRHS
jgi:glycosyltransferase involved in cell wall biosynthesis